MENDTDVCPVRKVGQADREVAYGAIARVRMIANQYQKLNPLEGLGVSKFSKLFFQSSSVLSLDE